MSSLGLLGWTHCDGGMGGTSTHTTLTLAHVVRLKNSARQQETKRGSDPKDLGTGLRSPIETGCQGEVVLWAKLFKIVVLFLDL